MTPAEAILHANAVVNVDPFIEDDAEWAQRLVDALPEGWALTEHGGAAHAYPQRDAPEATISDDPSSIEC